MDPYKYPRVGFVVIIVNKEGNILVGKRKGSHANQKYSIPGGHLELGERFEDGAIRELKEETNLEIKNPKVISVVNCLDTYREDNKHYISVILTTKEYSGNLKNMEPNKCEGWEWVDPKNLPQPHFDASELGVKCFLDNIFYTDK